VTIYLALGSFILLLGLILLYRSVPPACAVSICARSKFATHGGIATNAQNRYSFFSFDWFRNSDFAFPFHTWAPEAYASAPAPAAMLHAGVLKKFGLYGLLRVALARCQRRANIGHTSQSCSVWQHHLCRPRARSRRSGSIGCSVTRA
jgi:NADH-quinone oxidoreductase subunit M